MGENTKDLKTALWNSANVMRGTMSAGDYKSYLLGLIFYKYLSDKMLYSLVDLLDEEANTLDEALEIYRNNYEDESMRDELVSELKHQISYVLKPDLTFTALIHKIDDKTFQLEELLQAFKDIEQSDEIFKNLFEDLDIYSTKLGSTPPKRNNMLSNVMKELSNINIALHKGDMLGDAYEYLIGEFASDTGKKAGEFYTPQPVAKLMTQIVFSGKEDVSGFTIFDAAMGSGSLMLNAKKYSNEASTVTYFGQELNTSTYNLARMNMILHGVPVENQNLHNGDTLDKDWPVDEPTNFDAVVMNPPYSANWSADKGFMTDPRFSMYGVLPPRSKADYAFLLHGFYHLKNTGVMAIVLPHGILFRGNAEGKIRQKLLEDGAIDTVIGMPAGIFYNTGIPTTIIILKKKEREKRDVLFIDASKEFIKGKAQNSMNDEHLEKIIDAYIKRETIDKFSYLASFEEIKENDFNLNIPRYVDVYEEEEPINLGDVTAEIAKISKEIKNTQDLLLEMLQDLVGNDEESQSELQSAIINLKGEGV